MNENEIKYWNKFYSNFNATKCSDFCNFIINYFTDINIKNVIDCGCGNGRDSYKLASKYSVCGVDNSGFMPTNNGNCIFKNDDFTLIDKTNYDLVYSRFTFHSITNDQHLSFLKSINNNTFLAIETRSDKSENDHVYHGKNHYRNYTNIEYLKKILMDNNFQILHIEENNNLALYKDENPICIRVICKK